MSERLDNRLVYGSAIAPPELRSDQLFLVEMNRGRDENIGGAYYTVVAGLSRRVTDVTSASPEKGSDCCVTSKRRAHRSAMGPYVR
jgi:hypothetical protein